MNKCMIISSVALGTLISLLSTDVGQAGKVIPQKVRFAPLHIYLDTDNQKLAAYQFELSAVKGQVKIVGVEGGDHKAFGQPPYYDPAALAKDRIIIAAFNTGGDLPAGRTRIAALHLQIIGDVEPEYELKLIVSADAEGKELSAKLSLEKGDIK
jgi:hypothetical protein